MSDFISFYPPNDLPILGRIIDLGFEYDFGAEVRRVLETQPAVRSIIGMIIILEIAPRSILTAGCDALLGGSAEELAVSQVTETERSTAGYGGYGGFGKG